MYIVLVKNIPVGLFTSHTDAAESAKGLKDKIIYYCRPNSELVTVWDKINENPLIMSSSPHSDLVH